jgi:hypothetical protein
MAYRIEGDTVVPLGPVKAVKIRKTFRDRLARR